MAKKLVVIGGGSTYTPELIEGVLAHQDVLQLDEVCLVDVDARRLEILGGLTRRMVAREGNPFRITLTADRRAALPNATFVVTQIRVGGNATRTRDEELAISLGLLAQETTGPVGFANARRTIPEMWRIASDVAELCPDAWLINFTNPAGLVTEALHRRFPDLKVVGLCNIPPNMKRALARVLGCDPGEIELDYVGLNHLSWVRAARVAGRDRLPEALAALHADKSRLTTHYRDFPPAFLADLGYLPSPYLRYYYLHRTMLERQAREGARGRQVAIIEEQLLTLYQDPALNRAPAELGQRGGSWYSEAAAGLMASLAGGTPGVHVVNVPNGGSFAELPADAIIEVPVRVQNGRLVPEPLPPLGPSILGLIQAVKSFERLTVEAMISGDERLARLALATHPLVGDAAVAYKFYDHLLALDGPITSL